MAHGSPDYGVGAPSSTIYIVQDLAELAARLGSVDTFDRRGNVIWVTNFENGINGWIKDGSVAACAISWSAESSRNGSFCMKIFVPRPKNEWTEASYRLPILVFSKTGVEFCFDLSWGMDRFEIQYTLYDGTRKHIAGFRWNAFGHVGEYYADDGYWYHLEPYYYVERTPHLYHTIKLTIDPTTYKYVRLILDNTFWDMSALSYYTEADASAPHIIPAIEMLGGLNTEDSVSHVDHVIITQNET